MEKFFELPHMYESIIEYCKSLENDTVVTNVMQGEYWKAKKASFADRCVLPMFLHQDDFETYNPLGSHRGVGKVGGVYVVLSCLPPEFLSKTENIFLLLMYKSSDQNYISLRKMFARAIEELIFLEQKWITIELSSTRVQIYFSSATVIGDNLAVSTMMDFRKVFLQTCFVDFV